MYYLLRLITIIFTLLPRRIALKLGQLLGVFFYYIIPIRKKIIAVPARLNSSRLPKKVIADIGGKLMISRVLEQCKKSVPESNIVLCTDSEELSIIAKNLGINSLITSPDLTDIC